MTCHFLADSRSALSVGQLWILVLSLEAGASHWLPLAGSAAVVAYLSLPSAVAVPVAVSCV